MDQIAARCLQFTSLVWLVCLAIQIPGDLHSQDNLNGGGDPTQVSAEMAEVLRALRASEDQTTGSSRQDTAMTETISLAGLVVGGRQDPETANGTVILRIGESFLLAREGQSFQNGNKSYLVKAANATLVLLEEAGGEELVLRAQRTNLGIGNARDFALVEMQEVPLHLVARALSDEAAIRIAVSSQAREIPVSLYLQGITIAEALDSVVLTHRLYMTEIPGAEIVRLHTTDEYAQDAGSFRDERTQVFTLKYPNARDVALSIRDLYGDRVQLAERFEDVDQPGEYLSEDLQQRMERFDIIDARGQGFGVDSTGGNQGAQGNRSLSNLSNNLGSRNSRSFRNQNLSGQGDGQIDIDRFTAEDELSAEEIAALASGDAAMIEQLLRQRADIYVTVIDRLNKVMVRTRDDKTMKEICELVTSLDVPTPLVLLEVKILEVELDRGLDTAFDWNFNDGTSSASFTPQGPFPVGTEDLLFTYLSGSFNAQIAALQQANKLTTLGKPMLMTANNEVSRLFIGEEVPLNRNFSAGQDLINNGTVIPGAATTDIEFRPVGSTLLITPNINDDRTVSLRVLQEESRVVENGANVLVPNAAGGFSNQLIDTVSSQTASGTFVARDRETIAVGGMITESIVSQRSQIPGLGDIPVVGILARNQQLGRERKEIVLLLTPHIIKTPGEGEAITRQIMNEDSYHPNAPLGEGELGAFVRPNVLTTGSEEFGPLEKIQEKQILRAQPISAGEKSSAEGKPKGLFRKWWR
ncbi:MAG: hypothetical protein AAF357_05720 [Verrucomicrobiota bacterium]